MQTIKQAQVSAQVSAGWEINFGSRSSLAGIYLLKVNNKNTRTIWNMFKVNNKHTRTTVFINFEHISHLVVFLLLTLNMKLSAGKYHRTICLNCTWIYPKELHNSEYLVHLVHFALGQSTKRDKGTTPIRKKVLVRFKRSRGVFNLQIQVFVKLAKVFRSFLETKKFLISNWDGGPIIYCFITRCRRASKVVYSATFSSKSLSWNSTFNITR